MGSELPLKWLQLSSRVRTSVLPTERESKTCIFHGCSQKFTMGPTAGPPRPSQWGLQPVLPDPHGGAHSRSSWFTGMVGALQWIHLPFWCRLSETQTWVLTCRRSFPSSPSHVTKATLLSRADGSIPVSAPGVPPPATRYPGAVVRMLQCGGDFFRALLTCADEDLHILPGHPPSSEVVSL